MPVLVAVSQATYAC